MKFLSSIFLLCLTTTLSAFSQQIDYETARLSKVVTAVRINEKITLDGRLEEPAWKLALPATDFVQLQPRGGEPSPERTEVRFLYDDDNLYVGVNCFDSDAASIVVNGLRNDFAPGETDTVNVVIDSLHDRRSGFSFTTNAAGAQRDQQLSNDGQGNIDWDGVWDVRSSRNNEGWIGEFMIPFKTLRFTKSPTQEWGLNVGRRILHRNEESLWSPVPIRYSQFRVSLAGTLTGLENIHQGRNLKVKPFAIAGTVQSRNARGGLETQKDLDGGVDVKYSLTPSLTLDATYRTDFAQVEVDQQQVNLTRFSLFFPEQRDFFLENTSNFSFGPGGNLVPFFSRSIGLSKAGTPIPILGGARVSGKVNKYDVGFLAMKTDRLDTTPSNNYLVGRIKRNLFRNSWVGALATHRDSTAAGDYNRVYGADAHFQFYQKLEFDSYLLASNTPGKSGRNQARRFQSAWKDDALTISGEYNAVQTNFNPEVGFIRRENMGQYSGDFSWHPQLNNNDAIRNLTFGISTDYYESGSTGKVETRIQEGTLGITFDDSSSITFVTTQTFDRLVSPFGIRTDLSIPVGDYKYLAYTPGFRTNSSKKISGNGSLTWGKFWNGRQKAYTGGLNLKPDHHTNMDFSYRRNDVNLAGGSFTTHLAGARFTYGFTPRAFVTAFFQYNSDTHQVSSNIRFNITHHPLSDLYVVYNDTRDTSRGQVVGRALIIKFTNLFNF